MRSKYLYFTLTILNFTIFLPNASADTINAASCSQSDVQTAINSASDGDTVNIPSGNCKWLSQVSIPNTIGLTIVGAGRSETVITDGINNDTLLLINVGTGAIDISEIGFDGNAATTDGISDGIIRFWGGSDDNSNIRVHHCNFSNFEKRAVIVDSGENKIFALIDHCDFTTSHVPQGVTLIGEGGNSTWWYDNVTSKLGTDDFNFIEDCSFNWTGRSADAAVDMYGGAKAVVRHNTFRNIRFSIHGTDSGNYVSPLAFEVYENKFLNHLGSENEGKAFHARGGVGVVFNNSWESGYTALLELNSYRSTAAYLNWGQCNGSNSWDGNNDASGYPCLGQIGRGSDISGSKNYPLEPIYEWGNTHNGMDIDLGIIFNAAKAEHIKENRDYYNDTIKPGYVPYVYPHPLTNITEEALLSPQNFEQD